MLWLYKYKPTKIKDICGNTNVIMNLKKAIENNQNVIVYGEYGVGKNLSIQCILNELNAEKEDIFTINACSDRGIKMIRTELVSFLKYKSLKKKYVFIKDIINMNSGSQYGLCSIMEKYTNVSFIFCTNNYQCVIDSIQSRCCFFYFKMLEEHEITQFCKKILIAEKIEYEPDIFSLLYKLINGDMRKYIINLQSCSYDGKITKEHIMSILKTSFSNNIENIIIHIFQKDRKYCMNEIKNLLEQGYNHGDIIKYLFDYCISVDMDESKRILYLDCIGKTQIMNARGLYSKIQLDNLMIELCEI